VVTDIENAVVRSDFGGPADSAPAPDVLPPEHIPEPEAPSEAPMSTQPADPGPGDTGDSDNGGDAGGFEFPDLDHWFPSHPDVPGEEDDGSYDGGNEDTDSNDGWHPQEITPGGNSGEHGNTPGEKPAAPSDKDQNDGNIFEGIPMEDSATEIPSETSAEEESGEGILSFLDGNREEPEAVTEQPEPLPAPKPSVLDSINSNWLIGGLLIAMVLTVALILWPPKRKQGKKKR